MQANLVILPEVLAGDFLRFCQANPRPCPLLAVSEPGDPRLPTLGEGIDLRRDLPRYHIWRDGEMAEEVTEIGAFWRNDLVAFAIGCSFSFEDALREGGIPLRRLDAGRNVPMYRTALPTRPAGCFSGPIVVSLRPMPAAAAIEASILCARFPLAHGAPVHLGDPAMIGIADLDRPDYGDAPVFRHGDIPVFWACGVTPQAAIVATQAGIGHYPCAGSHAGYRPSGRAGRAGACRRLRAGLSGGVRSIDRARHDTGGTRAAARGSARRTGCGGGAVFAQTAGRRDFGGAGLCC